MSITQGSWEIQVAVTEKWARLTSLWQDSLSSVKQDPLKHGPGQDCCGQTLVSCWCMRTKIKIANKPRIVNIKCFLCNSTLLCHYRIVYSGGSVYIALSLDASGRHNSNCAMSETAIARADSRTSLNIFPCGSIASAPAIRSSICNAEPNICLAVRIGRNFRLSFKRWSSVIERPENCYI
jgi:hypothetical protein